MSDFVLRFTVPDTAFMRFCVDDSPDEELLASVRFVILSLWPDPPELVPDLRLTVPMELPATLVRRFAVSAMPVAEPVFEVPPLMPET